MLTGEQRIAILSVHSCPLGRAGTKDTGGMSTYLRELSRELGKRGIGVDLFTRIHDRAESEEIELGPHTRLIHLRAGAEKQVEKLDVYSALPEFVCNLQDYRRRHRLDYNLIFSHYWLSGLAGEYLQRLWDVPHMLMFHTLGALKNDTGSGPREPEIRLDTEKYLSRCCNRIIVPTEREKNALIGHYAVRPEKVGVVPCGVNLDLFQPLDKETARRYVGFPGEEKVVLYVGRIEPLKGLDRLLQAVGLVSLPEGQHLRLLIVGDDSHSGKEIQRMQMLCRELPRGVRVQFCGAVEHEELPYYYNAADLCAVVSDYESFGLVALESLACGTPVVATDVGELSRIIKPGETGYIIPERSPESFARNLSALLGETGDFSPRAVRESVAGYSWSRVAGRIAAEFAAVLESYFSPAQRA